MKQLESSVLRPFGSLIHGLAIMSAFIAAFYGFTLLVQASQVHAWQPKLLTAATGEPLFLILAALVLLIGVPWVWSVFSKSRGTYRAGPTDLEIWSGLHWRELKSLRYADISDVELARGPLMRVLGTSDLKIHARAFPHLVTLHGLRDAEEFRRFLLERRDSLRSLEDDEKALSQEALLRRLASVLERLERRS